MTTAEVTKTEQPIVAVEFGSGGWMKCSTCCDPDEDTATYDEYGYLTGWWPPNEGYTAEDMRRVFEEGPPDMAPAFTTDPSGRTMICPGCGATLWTFATGVPRKSTLPAEDREVGKSEEGTVMAAETHVVKECVTCGRQWWSFRCGPVSPFEESLRERFGDIVLDGNCDCGSEEYYLRREDQDVPGTGTRCRSLESVAPHLFEQVPTFRHPDAPDEEE